MYLLLLDAFVRGWILGDFGPWIAHSGILPFMHSLTEGWGVKGAALYFLKVRGQHGAPRPWATGVFLHMFSTSSHCHIIWKAQKDRPPPSHAEKQHRPIVTTVGFWIQYNKIALSYSPPTLPCFALISHAPGRNPRMVFLHIFIYNYFIFNSYLP